MTIVLTQNIFAQNAFFQRVKYDGKTSGIERVSPVKNKYMGLLVFNTGSHGGCLTASVAILFLHRFVRQ